MKKIKLTLILIFIAIALTACSGCEEPCDRNPTYRKEVGVGYVFAYDSEGVLHPVEEATVTVDNVYRTPGLFGKHAIVAVEHYITDAEGRYQVRFVEKGCFNKEMVYCNTYLFSPHFENSLGVTAEGIDIRAKDNILTLDTIKLHK